MCSNRLSRWDKLETGDASGTTRYIRASLVEESDLGASKIDPEDAPGMYFYPRWGEVRLFGQPIPDICDWNHWARDFVMQVRAQPFVLVDCTLRQRPTR